MQVSISEFHSHYPQYFLAALNGEQVYIMRGGLTFQLVAKLPEQHQLPRPEKQEDEEE